MRILLIINPGIPVPPMLYGGVERIVYLLAQEYNKLGHEVTLLAGPGSYCNGTTAIFGKNDESRSKWEIYKEIFFVWRFLKEENNQFDLIHNFGRLIYLLPVINKDVIKIMSYQRKVSTKGIKLFSFLPARKLTFTGCSDYCVTTGNVAGKWDTVYNAIDFSQYQLIESPEGQAPLMFLGRLDKIKGVHTAIKAAKATSSKLWIGGNIPTTLDNYAYFKKEIEPQIDNEQIIYLGELNDEQKNKYLGKAKALLFPIEWDEPFGIVMIESMACGTPVIAFNRGSVPEVVDKGITGIIVNTTDEMINAIDEVALIDRKRCRNHACERFDIKKVAHDYLGLN